jgi:hypothetical protein
MIEVPYTDEMTRLLERSVVHLFYYDARHPAAESTRQKFVESVDHGSDADIPFFGGQDEAQDENRLNPHRWHLLFVGELMGFQYIKRGSSRHGMLVCADFISYWEACKIYYGNQNLGNKHFKQAIFMGAAVAQRGKRKVKGADNLLKILRAKPSTIPKLQGLLGGIVHLLESITGVYDPKAKRRFRGVSDFFSQAELRLKLTKTLGASPNDLSSRFLTGGRGFRKLVRRVSRQFRGTSSYGQLVGLLLQQIHHGYYPVLAPPYRPTGTKAKVLKLVPIGSRSKLRKNTKPISALFDEAEDSFRERIRAREREVLGRPVNDPFKYVIEGATPKVAADTAGADAWAQETIVGLPSSRKTVEFAIEEVEALQSDPELSKKDKANLKQLKQRGEALRQAGTVFQTDLTRAREDADGNKTYPTHDQDNFVKASILVNKSGRIRKRTRTGPRYKAVEREIELTDRLITTLLCPEIWMVPPPRCNVIFPDMYSSYQYGRQFLTETTRLWLHGLRRNGKANLSRMYFAPNVDMINGQVGKKTAAKAASQAVSFLMPHEKFIGIIPVIQGLGNLEGLRKINKATEKKEGAPSVTSWRTKDPALARSSNYEFFRQRFKGRTLSGSGPFNPGLVLGLPGLVLDPKVVASRTSASGQVEVKGVHYLGLVSGVKHVISQKGASTAFQLSFVRAHNEGLNIFGEVKEGKVSVIKKVVVGGRKVSVNPAKPAVAEVLGFVTKKVRQKGADGKTEVVNKLVPSVGMHGIKGRTGAHVTSGLALQPSVPIKENVTAGATTKAGVLTKQSEAVAVNNVVLDRIPTDTTRGPFTYRVVPKKFKKSNSVEGTPTKITETTIIDGVKYHPKRSWMSGKALGAVEVDVFKASRPNPRVKKREFSFSFEMIARPPWLADIYLNQSIGDKFYGDLFGCKSLTDITLVTESPSPDVPESLKVDLGVPAPSQAPLSDSAAKKLRTLKGNKGALKSLQTVADIFTDLKQESDVADRTKVRIETEDGDEFEVPARVIGGVPIEVACEQLAETYVFLKASKQADTWHFIDTYTARKFASMVEVFGWGFRSGDPNESGKDTKGVIGTTYVEPTPPYDQSEMFQEQDQAQEGFHSWAFGDFTGMDLIDHDPLSNAQGAGSKKIQKSVDPRRERYFAAVDYRDSLTGVIGEKS